MRAGLLGWQASGTQTRRQRCQKGEPEHARMLVGSLLLVLYPHEPASHEYLMKPEKVTTACLLSIWHFCMSLLCVCAWDFLSFSPWHSSRSPFFLTWLIHGQGNKRTSSLLFMTGEKLYVLWANLRGSFPVFCVCVYMHRYGSQLPRNGSLNTLDGLFTLQWVLPV